VGWSRAGPSRPTSLSRPARLQCGLSGRAGADGLAELAALVELTAAAAGRRQDLRADEERAHHRHPEDEVGDRERGILHESTYRVVGRPSLDAKGVGRLSIP